MRLQQSRWMVSFDGDQLWVETPWFVVGAAYGGVDYAYNTYWWGLRLYTQPDWTAAEGDEIWKRYRSLIFRRVSRERAVEMGGCAL